VSPPKPVTPTKSTLTPWPSLTEDERGAIRRTVRLAVQKGGQNPNHAAGIAANLLNKNASNRIPLEHVIDALLDMKARNILASRDVAGGVEIWEVRR
jgi:hypothetical protein